MGQIVVLFVLLGTFGIIIVFMQSTIKRTFWLKKINEAWKRKSVVWLCGVRRVGKTFLTKSIENIEYFDCESPRTRREMEDPEGFLDKHRKKTIILDEIHKLSNPSELLKLAADYYTDIKVIATGSSTLGASRKFRDTLTDRKVDIWLTPMMSEDVVDFKNNNLEHRLLHGGLPPFFLSKEILDENFQSWIDAYWARDIQELFRLLDKPSFQKFAELLFIQSGGIFEATKFATQCEVGRKVINNYLKVLEETFVIHVIKPYSTHKPAEIVKAPKLYAFDTGFVSFYKGWDKLRKEDLGYLWEHYVLNEMLAHLQSKRINYWRDKNHHEIDFIISKRGKPPIAIECKWSANNFDASGIESFRRRYTKGENFVVCNDVQREFSRNIDGGKISFISLEGLIKKIS